MGVGSIGDVDRHDVSSELSEVEPVACSLVDELGDNQIGNGFMEESAFELGNAIEMGLDLEALNSAMGIDGTSDGWLKPDGCQSQCRIGDFLGIVDDSIGTKGTQLD